MTQKIAIGMSGGVDSSVTALLLQQEGYECVGATVQMIKKENNRDVEDAQSVAARLGIGHMVIDGTDAFAQHVLRRFVNTYESGGTPNPCIDCNRHMKFDYMFEQVKIAGCNFMATGHYARIRQRADGRWLLEKGADTDKDQSYFLYVMTQEMLSRTKLPLGGYHKDEVRRMAEEAGLLTARKRDSQDICFVPDGDYAAFIRRYTGKTYPQGNFVDENGNVLGRHQGMIDYTIGQRRGLGVAAKTPLYVCKKCLADNNVVLTENDRLFSRVLYANELNFIAVESLPAPIRCRARIRYRHKEQPAMVTQVDEDTIKVEFDEPQRAITAGQAVVLYDGDTVIGGGRIYQTSEEK